MKTLILALLAFGAAVLITLAVMNDNGYMLLGYGEWTVEGSLAFFLLLNLVAFALLYFVLRTIARIWAVPQQVRGWRQLRGAKRSRKFLTQGLVELSEGNWQQAEKDLIRFAGKSETPMLNYLAAARSAQQQGAHDRRDQYLQLAHESMPSADVAVGLTQAELQLDHAQLEQALATLKHLQTIAPKHAHVLKLLKELYERLDDWEELNRLLPDLKKRKVIEQEEQQKLEFNIFHNLLTQAAQDTKPEELESVWKKIPKSVRESEEMVTVFVNYLINRGSNDRVEGLLQEFIDRHWSDDLVELYGRVEIEDSARQLNVAEFWLQSHPQDPVLLLTLGRLCLRHKLWGKARSYFEASIGAAPSTPAYRELGVLLESMGEQTKALDCFKSGLKLSSDTPLPELPALLHPAGARLDAHGLESVPTDINPPPKLEVIEAK
ncbi:MAG: heme biosynthesis protein HemY [Candidatus Sedimenticola sp. (ex Thyasira tokunagai)]